MKKYISILVSRLWPVFSIQESEVYNEAICESDFRQGDGTEHNG